MHVIGRLFAGGLVGVALFFLIVRHSFAGVYTVAAVISVIAIACTGRRVPGSGGWRFRSLWNLVPVVAFAVAYYLTWY